MKVIRSDAGEVQWARIALMLALTVVSGYLATRSQRLGSRPDLEVQAKMRVALAEQKAGAALCRAGCALSVAGARAYDRARPV
jgi:hypothetical protein